MIVAGFGFRQSASLQSLKQALAATAHGDIHALAAPHDKAQAEVFVQFATHMALPIVAIQPSAMQSCETPTQSHHAKQHRQTGSVAEACALAAAGPKARLLSHRQISEDRLATCAVAQGETT